MEKCFEARFFLGANSPGGFYSLYDGFTDPMEDTLYILKGGPGCGKSTFMKKIASSVHDAGHSVEYIHCSGDPDSLDGIYFPDFHVGYTDGTSPHVMEPRFAGAVESYINIGEFYDLPALRSQKENIMRLTGAYKAYYARAFRLLDGAAAVAGSAAPPISEDTIITVARRTRGIICREIKSSGKSHGKTFKRFLSAVTCKGPICLYATVPELAEKVYILDNDLGLAHIVIEAVASAAEEKCWDTIRCASPLSPDVTEHLIIPELNLAFVSQTSRFPYPYEPYRHLRLDAIPLRDELSSGRSELRRTGKLRDALMDEAVTALQNAKNLHDRLEELYNPHVNFSGVEALAEKHIEIILK